MSLDMNSGEGVFIKGLMEDLPVHNGMVDLIKEWLKHFFGLSEEDLK